jgi:transposase
MNNTKAARRDFQALEQRRMKAATLLRKGWSQAAVARELGVSREAVSRWAKVMADQGRPGLKKAGRAGRKPRLDAVDLRRIEQALREGPEAWGYWTGLWTAERVAVVIEQVCGVRYHPGHVWRILRRLGWSCQRPTGRAVERDEKAIRRWKQQRWPELKKTLSEKAEPLSLSTRADSASALTGSAPGRHEGKPQSSSTTSAGRRSR